MPEPVGTVMVIVPLCTVQLGWIILPITGDGGVGGWSLITATAEGGEVQ